MPFVQVILSTWGCLLALQHPRKWSLQVSFLGHSYPFCLYGFHSNWWGDSPREENANNDVLLHLCQGSPFFGSYGLVSWDYRVCWYFDMSARSPFHLFYHVSESKTTWEVSRWRQICCIAQYEWPQHDCKVGGYRSCNRNPLHPRQKPVINPNC